MYPLIRSSCRLLPKAEFCRRNHHFSAATALYRKSNLLCPHSFAATNSARCLSEAILKSNLVAAVTDQLTQNDYVYIVQEKLVVLHEITGLPWWAVIVTSTIAIRTLVIFPLAVHQQRVVAKLHYVLKEMETTVEKEVSEATAKAAKENKWDVEYSNECYHNEVHNRRQELYTKHKCRPSKAFALVFVQIPVWVMMSGAIYNMNSRLPIHDDVAQQTYLDLKATSLSLFTDLTVPDETLVLPSFLIFLNFAIVQLREISTLPENTIFRSILLIPWRLGVILSFPFIALAPKCLTLYWLTSLLVGLFQNILFVRPKTRKMLGIPQIGTTRKGLFERLKSSFRSFYHLFKH